MCGNRICTAVSFFRDFVFPKRSFFAAWFITGTGQQRFLIRRQLICLCASFQQTSSFLASLNLPGYSRRSSISQKIAHVFPPRQPVFLAARLKRKTARRFICIYAFFRQTGTSSIAASFQMLLFSNHTVSRQSPGFRPCRRIAEMRLPERDLPIPRIQISRPFSARQSKTPRLPTAYSPLYFGKRAFPAALFPVCLTTAKKGAPAPLNFSPRPA